MLAILLISAIGFGYWYFSSGNQINSIAVMPFVNESGDKDVEYLSDGMTETLISSLSNLPNLNVKARSSVFRYKGKEFDPKKIASELDVQAILTGRVDQRDEQLTLNLELIDAQTENVIWSEKYDRKTSDLVKLQSEIAKDVSRKLKAKLSGAEAEKVTKTYTTNPEAYQAYLKGRYYWNRRTGENLKKAIEQFKTAADKDPNYALAYVGLADCYALLREYAGTPSSETLPKAKDFAEKALSIDSSLAEPHATLGLINHKLWRWDESEKDFKRAIELNPNYATTYHWYSILLKVLGRYDESATMIHQANKLDPLSSIIGTNISLMYQSQNNHDASIKNSLKILELDPNFASAYRHLGLSYLKLGRNAEAISAEEKAVQLTNRGAALSSLGYVYAATGKQAKAIAIIKELESTHSRNEATGMNLAAIYAGLGDKDKAFEWLEKDFQARNGGLIRLRYEIPYESLRDDPRYKDLLKRMGLPE
jgi:TolB-like protein/Tfp pilus assembly protein PilF